MKDPLSEVERSFREALDKAADLAALESLRIEALGKRGALTLLLKEVGKLSAAERPKMGERVNLLRDRLEALLSEKKGNLEDQSIARDLEGERIDITLPGRRPMSGTLHPLTLVEEQAADIFRSIGFSIEEGPEAETDYYNFEALNFPADHPARDMQDTLFLEGGLLLRTHTSPVQVRTMERKAPPLQFIVPGRVYRRDFGVSRSPVFHQIEGLCVGPKVTFSDLKGTLEAFVHLFFGRDIATRLRPSFFPFTEPSGELDITCMLCKGKGCRVCKGSGWVEVLGCGMVHPNVFHFAQKVWQARGEVGPYDPEKISGFAFGMGIERLAMLKYQIDDIRLFYENDVRFLRQFPGMP